MGRESKGLKVRKVDGGKGRDRRGGEGRGGGRGECQLTKVMNIYKCAKCQVCSE